jgi:hypothetical protein
MLLLLVPFFRKKSKRIKNTRLLHSWQCHGAQDKRFCDCHTRRIQGKVGNPGIVTFQISIYESGLLLLVSISVTWLITLKEGGQNWPWILGTLFYKEVKFEGGRKWSIKRKFFIFFSLSVFYLTLFNSITKKISRLKKYWGGGAFAPLPLPKFTPMLVRVAEM